MKTVLIGILTAVVVVAVVAAGDDKAQDAERLLKAAMNTELVDGNLKGAIEQYKKVVQSGNRPLAVQALVHMAECYQKLGDAEARKIYEQVLRDYADQKEAVVLARALLGRADAGATATAMTLKKVWAGPKLDFIPLGRISPDGRSLSYVDWETGDLAVHDLATGGDRRLTNKGTWAQSGEFAQESAVSRDGNQVAYSWFSGKDRYELRMADLRTTGVPQPRRLFDNEDVTWIGPYDWSPDGKWIAVQLQRKDRTNQVGLIAVQDSSLRVLKSGDWRGSSSMFFSPNGKYLAFDLLPNDVPEGQRDVFVLAIDGSEEIPAVVNPGQDAVMGWTPDGKELLFASDRSGTLGLWALPLAEGKPRGAPALIKADIAPRSLGVTRSGALYMGVSLGGHDIQVASLDLNTGKLLSAPRNPVQSFVGFNSQPDWSPDGKYLAYVSSRGPAGGSRNHVLAILSLETGQVRELRPTLTYFDSPRWAPDGRSFIAQGSDFKGRGGAYQIDAQTAEATLVAVSPSETAGIGPPEWSPDGKRIYYRRGVPGTDDYVLVERDLASESERELIRRDIGLATALSVSPDGRYIAVQHNDRSTKSSAVLLIPSSGGEPRDLIRVNQPQRLGPVVTWAPDGRGVIVRKFLTESHDRSERWLVPLGDGQPRKLLIDGSVVGPIRVHPDGRQIAFNAGEEKWEVWVLEHFLPSLSATK